MILFILGFVEFHQNIIVTTLTDLVAYTHSAMHCCYGDVKPRFVQLCECLNLSKKVC